jgi:hypothetical protein
MFVLPSPFLPTKIETPGSSVRSKVE